MATINDIRDFYKCNFPAAISSIEECSTDDDGYPLVKEPNECINYDRVKDDGKLQLCSVDALYFCEEKNSIYFIEFKNRNINNGGVLNNAKMSAEASFLMNDFLENKYKVSCDDAIKKVFILVVSSIKSATYFSKVSRCLTCKMSTKEMNFLKNNINGKRVFGPFYDDIQILDENQFVSNIL